MSCRSVILTLGLILSFCFAAGRGLSLSPPKTDQPDSLSSSYLFTEGLKSYLIDKDTVRARSIFEKIITVNPAYAPAYYQLAATSLFQQNDSTAAFARRAYRLDTTNLWYAKLYGQTLVMRADYDMAREIYLKLYRDEPHNPDNYRLLAILYQQAGMPLAAISILDSAEMRLGRIRPLTDIKRQLLIATRQVNRAIDEAKAMVEAIPYEAENHSALAELYSASGQDSLAEAEFRKAIAIDSTMFIVLASTADHYSRKQDYRSYLSIIRRMFALDNIGVADKVKYFNQLTGDIKFYRDYYPQLNEMASVLAVKYPDNKDVVELYAGHLIASGQVEQALELYKIHLDDSPPQKKYYINVIEIESYFQRTDSADLYINHALALFPDDVNLHIMRGNTLAYTKRSHEAVDSYRQSLKYVDTDSLRGVIWGLIGDTYHQIAIGGDGHKPKSSFHKKTYEAYDKSLMYYRDNPAVLNNYAYFLSEEARNLEKALEMASRTVALTDNNPTYLDTYGWVLFKLGRVAEAKKIMQQAVSLDRRNSPELLLHYGDILSALGEDFLAETYWRRALDNGYDPSAVEERIERQKTKTKK